MTDQKLDVSGKGCPHCLIMTRRKLSTMDSGETLKVECDHPKAALENIPFGMKQDGHKLETKKVKPGFWELTITKK
ncbi:MAG: sulfurtransferase TusA family protein [Candidatus Lokiarchaeota archaeon]|nr:sulfurtransferase TusA family protein [Candidatus Lokiarchaeota archaeon]